MNCFFEFFFFNEPHTALEGKQDACEFYFLNQISRAKKRPKKGPKKDPRPEKSSSQTQIGRLKVSFQNNSERSQFSTR
jgi:hypothetical protein